MKIFTGAEGKQFVIIKYSNLELHKHKILSELFHSGSVVPKIVETTTNKPVGIAEEDILSKSGNRGIYTKVEYLGDDMKETLNNNLSKEAVRVLLVNFAYINAQLHSHGIVGGDSHLRNFIVDSELNVYRIDCDKSIFYLSEEFPTFQKILLYEDFLEKGMDYTERKEFIIEQIREETSQIFEVCDEILNHSTFSFTEEEKRGLKDSFGESYFTNLSDPFLKIIKE